MPIAIAIRAPGGTEVLQAVKIDIPEPASHEVRLRQTAIGVNYIDIYFRTGLYPLPNSPAVLGFEAAGIVDAVGSSVTTLRPGDRVAYCGGSIGAYAEVRVLPESRLIKLPDTVSDRLAGGSMLRGLTAHMLLYTVYNIKTGDWVLVHAAAGGLGQLVTRWAKRLGARVIGVVGHEHKISVAQAAGADAVVLRHATDWASQVKAIAEDRGVHLAIDGIGGSVLAQTIATVRPFGVVASLGQPAGPIPPLAVEDLGFSRSIALARPSVIAYANDPTLYQEGCAALMKFLTGENGMRSEIEFPLPGADKAHAALQSGRTIGSMILTTEK